jgi:dipeptidyl aminopeptidase/acylaminoacyl peptidase
MQLKFEKALLVVVLVFTTFYLHADPPPLSGFSDLPAVTGVKLSPSGNRLVFIQNSAIDGGSSILSVIDIEKKERKNLLFSDNEKIKFNWFRWANEDIVLVSGKFETKLGGSLFHQTRLLKIDVRDKNPEPEALIKPRSKTVYSQNNFVQFQDSVIDYLPNDPKHILMQIDLDTHALPSVFKVNVYTKRKTRVERGKKNIRHWITDQQGLVRIGMARVFDETVITYLHRKNKDSDFEVLFEGDFLTENDVDILGFGLDPNVLYYRAYEGNYKAIFRMDLTSKNSERVLAHDKYDAGSTLIYSYKTRDVIGVYDSYSETGKYYFDDADYKLARGLKTAVEGKQVSIISMDNNENRYVAYVQAANTPPLYFIGDRQQESLSYLFSQYPKLDGFTFPEHELVSYQAQDGTKIEGYLTLPLEGKKPFTMIIHPHGGPGVRDFDGFDPWVSYMTSRGYAVLRPNFRGSSGFGFEFAQAQMGRWGLEMQDDISDAAKWLVDQGISDPQKLCIFGASYGGYAAQMAAVKTPDLFTCSVSFAGVSDLERLYRDTKRFLGGKSTAKIQIGDERQDRKARSPINAVDKITIPMLIMHGEEDVVVNVNQSRRLIDKFEDAGVDYKYVEFERGNHHLSIQHNRTQFFEELDSFFQLHLSPEKVKNK